ncbi:MAG: hypothetical protein KBS82_05675 [Oscillospiraceae bacterium]|nr:hypothetical protein [Candidatus Limimonas egerieequi]
MINSVDITGSIDNYKIEGSITNTTGITGDITSCNGITGDLGVLYKLECETTTQEITGDIRGGVSHIAEVDPTVPDWAKQSNKPEYVWQEILDKPSINAIELMGNKQLEDLNIKYLTNEQILEAWNKI